MMDRDFIKDRVSAIRYAHNMSARSLSLNLGMSSEYVNQLEMGRMSPSVDFLINFCDYFGLTMSEFFDENVVYPCETKRIVKYLNSLSHESVQKLMDFLESIGE